MGVFGAVCGRKGVVGFNGAVLGVSSGVVGFNVALFLRAVRDICRPASPAPSVVREIVSPANPKWVKSAVGRCAGRVFSWKSCGMGCAGRVFRGTAGPHGGRVVRPQWLRPPLISRGATSHVVPLKAFQVVNSNR